MRLASLIRSLAALAALSLSLSTSARAAPDGFEELRPGQTFVYDEGGATSSEEIAAISSDDVTVRVTRRPAGGPEERYETRGPRSLVRWVKTRWSMVLPRQDALDRFAAEAEGSPLQPLAPAGADLTVSGIRFPCAMVEETRRECLEAGDQRVAVAVRYQRAVCARYPFCLRTTRGDGPGARPVFALTEVRGR